MLLCYIITLINDNLKKILVWDGGALQDLAALNEHLVLLYLNVPLLLFKANSFSQLFKYNFKIIVDFNLWPDKTAYDFLLF